MWADAKHTDRVTDNTWSTRLLKLKMVCVLLLYWCHTGILTIPGQWPKIIQTTNTCLLHLKTNTEFLQLHLSQPGAERAQTAKLSRLHLFSSPVLGLLFPTFLQCPSSFPIHLSLFESPSRACKTALSWDTICPTWVAHWLQLNHLKLQHYNDKPQLLILHNHKLPLWQSLKCTKAPNVI